MSGNGILHVLCFGNLWQGDDGFGIHVFERLRAMDNQPVYVKIFDAGIAGLDALEYFENCCKVVVVDAVMTGSEIGTIHRFSLEDLSLTNEEFSLHSAGLSHLLFSLPILFEGKSMPKVVLIGAEIGKIEPFTDRLSPVIESAISKAIEMVQKECIR